MNDTPHPQLISALSFRAFSTHGEFIMSAMSIEYPGVGDEDDEEDEEEEKE